MICKNCGGDMVGDGHTEVHHCERADVIGEGYEPDANPVYCAALSQQAEPAPAQDERDSVIAHIELCITNLKAEHQTNPRVIAEVLYNIGYSRATRPVQTAPQPEQSGWISVEDRLPEPGRYGARVLCWREGWSQPREMKWAANTAAKTEAGRRPRWEETRGSLAFSAPTHWMPMPAAPGLSTQGESHE